MTTGRPKALIVDFGGVLTTSMWDSFTAFCHEHGVDPDRLKSLLSHEVYAHTGASAHPIHLVETGHMSAEEFDRHLAEVLSEGLDTPLDATDLKHKLFAAIRPEPIMVNAVIAARAHGVKTALLSNSWGDGGYPRETFDAMFDAVVLSGEVALRKPQIQIYEMACRLLDVDPSEAVFVDDVRANVEGAEAAGMTGVLHRDPAETLARLETLFGLALGPG